MADPEVARTLESLATISPPVPARSLRQSEEARALFYARTCYDHLAGKLGVAITQSLIDKGYFEELEEGYLLTPGGQNWLRDFGVSTTKKHMAMPYHIDWTERVRHIAGPVAVAMTHRMLELGWITRGEIRRSICITELGKMELFNHFDLLM